MITIPTISQLYTSVKADIEAEYGSSIPLFGKIFLNVLAIVQAAKLKLFYLAIADLQKNIFVDTADSEFSGGTLERFGRIKLGRNPFPATAAQYEIEVTGTIGANIPASTTFKSNDDSLNPGKMFMLDNAFVLVTNPDTIIVRALEAGLDSKLEVGDQLSATAPIANVNSLTEVVTETVVPLAAEELEEYRTKALEAYQLETQGGASSDYRLWAADAQGVQQTYAYAKSGSANEANLFVEATIADSTDGKGTPTAGILADVEDVIEFDPDTTKPLSERGRRPLTVQQVHVLPVTIKTIDIVVNNSLGAFTAAEKTAVFDALTAELARVRPFVSGADILEDKNDILNTNKVISVILGVKPNAAFDIVLKVDTIPLSTYTFTNGDIPWLNTVTYP
jgi:uncharacterized phage protein gp47/JayE